MKTRVLTIFAALIATFALAVSPALAWHNWIEGQPTLFGPGSVRGYYFWHDAAGLHLRTTTRGEWHEFTGRLTTDGTFYNVTVVRPEGNDVVVEGGSVLTFAFHTSDGVDGVDFRIDGGNDLRLALNIDGHRIDNDRVFVGQANAHPASNPFVVVR